MITLINPNLVVQRNDIFTTGIVYMPIGLAYFAGAIIKQGFECTVIDAFGEKPNQLTIKDSFIIRGLTPEQITKKISPQTRAIVVYAINMSSHGSMVDIIKHAKALFPKIPLIVMENSHAVTAYSIRRLLKDIFNVGADYVITGEPEERGIRLLEYLKTDATHEQIKEIDGIGYTNKGNIHYTDPKQDIQNLNSLPFPAWELFPLNNYWKLRYAHGPLETDKYLPLLTSRGCPFGCTFCVIPETNHRHWRKRDPRNVVDEMETFYNRYGIKEFHIEDVNPTVDNERTQALCEEIIKRKLPVIWKIAAGTKAETIQDEATIELLARAGCRYISISPESGSSKIMEKINKPFNINHAVTLIKKMNQVGIYSQACFVLGFPGEEDADRSMTWALVRRLTQSGVDEIALFIVSPLPGSALFSMIDGYKNYSQLSFSPSWRKDYHKLNTFRLKLYGAFLWWKCIYHPVKLMKQPLNFLMRSFKTKMEMVPYRALHTKLLTFFLKEEIE